MTEPAAAPRYIIGLDYGTESARGVLIEVETGRQVGSHVHPYRHGVMTTAPLDGAPLPRGWALQNADDYIEAAECVLSALGRGRNVESIGVGFTASSPLPATMAGEPLSRLHPDEPHAYVKLWKHGAAQPYADQIGAGGGPFLDRFGGRVSGEWLLAKAMQVAAEAPDIWARTDRFIEAGDWLVWQLTDRETRSLGFAAYKAQYSDADGYPAHLLDGLGSRLAEPVRVGSAAGSLSSSWRARTGVLGHAIVAVAVIDSHVVLPAVGAVTKGCLVAALGTSAVYLYLADEFRPLPPGIEGVAFDGSVRDLWCYEAGQAGFGDTLAWFARTFPRADEISETFRIYNDEAAELRPGEGRLLALDWWSGNRVPLADSRLSGLLVGLTTRNTSTHVYLALLESVCFGARTILDLFEGGGLPIERIILTSGLAERNPLLIRIMADVLGSVVEVPDVDNPTATGAAIHGAVASGLVQNYAEGTSRFGARSVRSIAPDAGRSVAYGRLYRAYRKLSADTQLRDVMHELASILDD